MAHEDTDTTGWLTAQEAASALGGISQATLTRLAKDGAVEREQVNGKWLYDPASFPGPGEGPIARPTTPIVDPQAVMLHGGAEMVRAASTSMLQMVDRILASQKATLDALEQNAKIHQALFEQMAARCQTLESSHTEMVQAREKMLDRSAEREAVAAHLDRSDALKAKVLTQLAENAGPLLALAGALLKVGGEPCDTDTNEPEPEIVEQPPEPSDSSQSPSTSGSH